ncbi:MAG TPA: SPOR domain-containing protein [Usitatibacter sp.]|nr:SPOR domain-containing protein [Usitatibacter sp.]
MASSTSPEASEIRRRGRRRLLGAVTLVLLAVVFVPMILDNEPRTQGTEPSLIIPNRELAKPLPQPAPAAGAQATTPANAASAQPTTPVTSGTSASKPASPAASPSTNAAQAAREPATAPATPASPAAASAAPKPATVAVAAPKAPDTENPGAPKLEGFAVQVGAFRDEAHLEQVRQKLTAAGVVHYTERIDSGGAPVTRLRAGPFPTREAAESARATLHQASLDGQVVPLP